MKLLLSCDDVFDTLTHGPFPTGGAEDAALESHLCSCHECRQLAEALRPAVALLHEAIPSRATNLPRYEGTLPARELLVGEPSLAARVRSLLDDEQLALTPRQFATADAQRRWPGYTAVAALALALVALWFAAVPAENQSPLPRASQASAPSLEQLAALHLPRICLTSAPAMAATTPSPGDSLPPAENLSDLLCCTRCHHAGDGAAPGLRLIASLQQSCMVCHKS